MSAVRRNWIYSVSHPLAPKSEYVLFRALRFLRTLPIPSFVVFSFFLKELLRIGSLFVVTVCQRAI